MSQWLGRRIGVLMGGWGEEREISRQTGEAICAALAARGYDATPIVAGADLDQVLRREGIEVAFLALHGRMGEDGRVQGLLEVLGIPYTGSGTLASALAMNKRMAKKVFRQHNIATPVGYSVRRSELEQVARAHTDLGFPCVVKPACGGSSVGLSVVTSYEQLTQAMSEACAFGGEALVERFHKGKEITVALLNGEVLGSCEIGFSGETFDFQKKYVEGAKYFLPPRLSDVRVSNVHAMALTAYQALECRGPARVDFICSEQGNDVVLEVNTMPGMTRTSLLPKIAKFAGIDFDSLCVKILDSAQLDESVVVSVPTRREETGVSVPA